MKDYFEPEIQFPEDDLWEDISEENGFPWDNETAIEGAEKEKKTIHVVLVEPGKMAREADIGTELSELQEAVGGGWISTFYPFDEAVCCVIDDEGKINGSFPNRAIYDENGHVDDVIFGPFFICDCSTEEFGSLTSEQAERYKKMFLKPERFMMASGEIIATKYTPPHSRGGR